MPNAGSSSTHGAQGITPATRGIRFVPNITQDRYQDFTGTEKPGQQRQVVRLASTTGDNDYRLHDAGGNEVARLRPGTFGRVRTQFSGADGANTPSSGLNVLVPIEAQSNEVIRRKRLLASGDSSTDAGSLQAWPAMYRGAGNVAYVDDFGGHWYLVASANESSADTTGLIVLKPSDVAGSGHRWYRAPGTYVFKIAVDHTVADATNLLLVPNMTTGAQPRVEIVEAMLETTTTWTGSSAALGLSTTSTLANTKGDVMGGASGDAIANFNTTTPFYGSFGPKLSLAQRLVLRAGEALRWDVFGTLSAGVGVIHCTARILG
jgi:hypothetical protein